MLLCALIDRLRIDSWEDTILIVSWKQQLSSSSPLGCCPPGWHEPITCLHLTPFFFSPTLTNFTSSFTTYINLLFFFLLLRPTAGGNSRQIFTVSAPCAFQPTAKTNKQIDKLQLPSVSDQSQLYYLSSFHWLLIDFELKREQLLFN